MSDDKAEIVRSWWRFWASGRKAEGLSLMSDDLFYGLYVPEDVLLFGGETRGKAAGSDRLQTILDHFYLIKYVGEVVKVDGDVVHGRVEYCFRHKVTGEDIDGTMRQVIEFRDGLIVSWREYTDAARVQAFMRLVSHLADNS